MTTAVAGGNSDRLTVRQVLLIATLVGITVAILLISGANSFSSVNDFGAYWSAARQFVHGGDPYDTDAVLQIERGLGFQLSSPLVLRNPPWVLPVIAPLGFLQFPVAQLLWFFAAAVALILSVHILWRLYMGDKYRWLSWIMAGIFLPLAVALSIGQIGPVLLWGLSGVLHFTERGQYRRAGAAMFLLALKPHLVWLLWPVLLLYSVRRRRWQMLLSFGVVFATACLAAFLIDHSVYRQYFLLWRKISLLEELTPTGGGLLRLWLGSISAQFLPMAIAAIWFGYYWVRPSSIWQWRDGVPLLLLISVATTSYAWFFDQVVLLPCIFHATASVVRSSTKAIFWSAASYLTLNLAVLLLILRHRTGFWYVWTAPAWLLWYLVVRWQKTGANSGLPSG